MTTRLISLEEKLIMNQTLLEDKSKRIAALENSLSE